MSMWCQPHGIGSTGDSSTCQVQYSVLCDVISCLNHKMTFREDYWSKFGLLYRTSVLAMEVERHSFLTSPLDGGECLVSCSSRFIPKERTLVAHWIGGWRAPVSTCAHFQPLQRLGRWFLEFEALEQNYISAVGVLLSEKCRTAKYRLGRGQCCSFHCFKPPLNTPVWAAIYKCLLTFNPTADEFSIQRVQLAHFIA
jgi:hypothetical protein